MISINFVNNNFTKNICRQLSTYKCGLQWSVIVQGVEHFRLIEIRLDMKNWKRKTKCYLTQYFEASEIRKKKKAINRDTAGCIIHEQTRDLRGTHFTRGYVINVLSKRKCCLKSLLRKSSERRNGKKQPTLTSRDEIRSCM